MALTFKDKKNNPIKTDGVEVSGSTFTGPPIAGAETLITPKVGSLDYYDALLKKKMVQELGYSGSFNLSLPAARRYNRLVLMNGEVMLGQFKRVGAVSYEGHSDNDEADVRVHDQFVAYAVLEPAPPEMPLEAGMSVPLTPGNELKFTYAALDTAVDKYAPSDDEDDDYPVDDGPPDGYG